MAQSTPTGTSAHTEAPGGSHKPGFPPFQKETFATQLFWLTICFVALYLLVARVGLPRVGSIIEARQSRVAGDLAEAGRLRSEADEALAAYDKALADARNRAQTIAAEIRDKLNAEAEKNRKRLEQQLNARLAKAEELIAVTKAAAMANVRGIAVEAAAAIVVRLVGVTPAEMVVAAAVDDVLER
jgi:F-type H+-transporting ATPase subunit b